MVVENISRFWSARPILRHRCWCAYIRSASLAICSGACAAIAGTSGAIAAIARAGGGLLLYLAQEGRGIGLVNKLRAYHLQDAGFDTLDANEQLGFDADERVYLPAAEMMRQLGFGTVRLLTNNPDKVAALERYGIRVAERVPHVFPSNRHNECYLRTKATRSGHFLWSADP
jgi:GTP cyclohydrolase II